MKQLSEQFVQEVTKDYLANRYKRTARRRNIFAKIEVRTKKQYGGKRADGVIAFKHWWKGTYVVSFEAKSFKTLASMKPQTDYKYLLKNSLWAGLIICILSGSFFFLYKSEVSNWQLWAPLLAFLGGALTYAIVPWSACTNKRV